MRTATHDDVLEFFPDLPDHAVVEILAMQPTVTELDAAMLLQTSDDEELIDIKRRDNDRLHQLLTILDAAEIDAVDDPRR